MRLSKKIAAVALAAVMAVSMLTACGDNDAPQFQQSWQQLQFEQQLQR